MARDPAMRRAGEAICAAPTTRLRRSGSAPIAGRSSRRSPAKPATHSFSTWQRASSRSPSTIGVCRPSGHQRAGVSPSLANAVAAEGSPAKDRAAVPSTASVGARGVRFEQRVFERLAS